MPQANSIATHIPFLRRFARALTGSQASGDAYAFATLEAIAESGDTAHTRQSLFRAFLKVWISIPLNQTSQSDPGSAIMAAADRTLDGLTPMPRVAFLLRALEGFTTEEIADMLGRTPEDVQDLLADAGREIAAQLCTNVLIIEDEPIIAMDLEALVTDLGHSVLPIARTRKEAVVAMKRDKPGLILADIRLADGSSGLDAVNEILTEFEVPVVFITAFPEQLLTGSRPEPTFLITKPFRVETVQAIISQALFFDRRASVTAQAAI